MGFKWKYAVSKKKIAGNERYCNFFNKGPRVKVAEERFLLLHLNLGG
jgi:hypothetical protein